jgi:hypothetical protein
MQQGRRFTRVVPLCPHPLPPNENLRLQRREAGRSGKRQARGTWAGQGTRSCRPPCTIARRTPIKGIGFRVSGAKATLNMGPLPIRASESRACPQAQQRRPQCRGNRQSTCRQSGPEQCASVTAWRSSRLRSSLRCRRRRRAGMACRCYGSEDGGRYPYIKSLRNIYTMIAGRRCSA